MTDRELLRLDEQMCFALYTASRAVIQLYRPVLDGLGLTYPQYLVMLVLWQTGPRLVKELGTELSLDSGTLSPLLKRLESTGYVRRQRCVEDERAVRVYLTDDGAALRERAACVPHTLAKAAGMEIEELDALRKGLARLTDAVSGTSLTDDRE